MSDQLKTGSQAAYNRLLLIVAGLGGLLYGIDVGIIAGALPYLEATSGFSAQQIGTVVAAVLLGSVLSSLFAGALADLFGRKKIMLLSALLFILSVPVICLSQSFTALVAGRLLQGISGGLIGVVVPLYLAECLGANSRGKGTGIFQFLLTVGLVFAALIALYFGNQVERLEMAGATVDQLFAAKNNAWRMIFWVSIIPGIVFFLGGLLVTESPRWLFRKNRKDEARAALVKSSGELGADVILREMEETENPSPATASASHAAGGSGKLLQRRYIYPFLLAVVILACNQLTGINSVLAYSVKIFQQAGLVGVMGNYGDTVLKIVNCIMTVVAVVLVDKAGRKFLLKMGTAGIIAGLVGAAVLFLGIERQRKDVTSEVQSLVDSSAATLKVDLANPEILGKLGASSADTVEKQLVVTFQRGSDGGTELVNSKPITLQNGKVKEPLLEIGATKDPENKEPLKILKAEIGPRPSTNTGWLVTACFVLFIAAYAAGPGVCVWLALSELMPNRIRSNGMSIALLINQGVSTSIAWLFLPAVGKFGYSSMFAIWAACSVVYFITAAFFLPETKGKTLEEIEEHFEGKKSA
jgi:SP family myo-inositol transporter-like MFS transporter 13